MSKYIPQIPMLIVALYGVLWEDFHASLQYLNKPVGMKSSIFNLLKCNSRKLIDLPKYNQTPSPHCFQFETFAAATPLSTSWNKYKPLCCPSLVHFGALHESERIRKKITHWYSRSSASLQKTSTTAAHYLLVGRTGRDGSKNLPILPYHERGSLKVHKTFCLNLC